MSTRVVAFERPDATIRLRPDITVSVGTETVVVSGDDTDCRPTKAFLWHTPEDGIKLLEICRNCGGLITKEVSENAPNYGELFPRAPFPKN